MTQRITRAHLDAKCDTLNRMTLHESTTHKGHIMKLFICCVTYYGEYRPDTEPRVFARDADHAIEKARVWCTGMNQAALQIRAYPYINGFASDTNDDDDAGLSPADLAQFYGPSVRI